MKELLEILKTIPSSAWSALATAILTSTITLAGVWLTNRNNNIRLRIQLDHELRLRESEIYRDRLEELYVISNKWLGLLISHYLPFRGVMKGELTFNQALDITIESGSKIDYEPHRVTMLINLYFPEIKSEFDQMMEIREKLNRLVDGYKEQYKRGNFDGVRWLEAFQPLFEKLGILSDEFTTHIVKLKKSYTSSHFSGPANDVGPLNSPLA